MTLWDISVEEDVRDITQYIEEYKQPILSGMTGDLKPPVVWKLMYLYCILLDCMFNVQLENGMVLVVIPLAH